MTDEKHERRPFAIGTVVGFDGQRVAIASWRPDDPFRVIVRMPDGVYRWASLGELHVAPELDEHVQEAAVVVAGHIGNQRAIFESED